MSCGRAEALSLRRRDMPASTELPPASVTRSIPAAAARPTNPSVVAPLASPPTTFATTHRVCLFAGLFTAATAAALLAPRPAWFVAARSPLSVSPPRVATKPSSGAVTMSSSASAASQVYGGGTGITVPARERVSAALIFLHGLGDSAHGWAPAFPLRDLPYVETVLPTANVVPVSLNGGMPGTSWFDLFGLDDSAPDDEPGIAKAAMRVDEIVRSVAARHDVPSSRVVIAGFSQGAALALTSALRLAQNGTAVAGVAALSGWLPARASLPSPLPDSFIRTPVFMAHGRDDMVVPAKFGKLSADLLKERGASVTFTQYAGLGHSAIPEELEDFRAFVAKVLPPV